MVYEFTKWWYYPLCRLFLRRIDGMGNIPENTNFILVANHNKWIDPLLVAYPIIRCLNKKVHFIASPKWWPILGDLICRKWAGCIPLFTPKQAYNEAKRMIKNGEVVGIFPEGHLKHRKKNPRKGAIRLAVETKIPILPVKVNSHYFPFMSTITFGRLITPEKIKQDYKNPQRLIDEIYNLDVRYIIEIEFVNRGVIESANQKV